MELELEREPEPEREPELEPELELEREPEREPERERERELERELEREFMKKENWSTPRESLYGRGWIHKCGLCGEEFDLGGMKYGSLTPSMMATGNSARAVLLRHIMAAHPDVTHDIEGDPLEPEFQVLKAGLAITTTTTTAPVVDDSPSIPLIVGEIDLPF